MGIRRVVPDLTTDDLAGSRDFYHRQALDRSLDIVYPLTDEEWGVRRFFVLDPNGRVLNVMSHRAD